MTARNLILATAGHVDHGKSALVRALTGTETDRLPEEKKRGITIDLGFAHLALPGFSLGVIDVPGHEDFIRNMIAGIGSIDLALLVVAADDGWMAQTEEHLQILHYLGVRHGVIAITKSDLGAAARVAEEARERLRGSSLGEAPIVATSVRNQTGLELLRESLGKICATVPPARDCGKPRLFVDRAFTVRGAGTIVTGTLSGGCLARDERVSLQPQNVSTRIRTLQSHHQPVEVALPATRAALNLVDLQPNDIARGSVVTAVAAESSRALDVRLERSARSTGSLKRGVTVRLHYGSAHFAARVSLLERDELLSGATTIARLRLQEPVFAFVGDRFVLRDPSARATIAGGVILDPDAGLVRFRSPAQRELLVARAAAPNDVAVLLSSQLRRDRKARSEHLLLKTNFSAGEIAATVASLVESGALFRKRNLIAEIDWWRSLRERAAQAINAKHATQPNEPGLELTRLRATLAMQDAQFFEALVEDLCAADFDRANTTIRRRTHCPALPPPLQRAAAEIQAVLAARPFDPPSRKELAPTPQAEEALRFLCQTNEVVRLSEETLVSARAFAEMKKRLASALRVRGAASASELRQALGTTRRVLIPLLERLDRDGLTIRQGDRRSLR